MAPPPSPVLPATAVPEEIIVEEDPMEMVLEQEAPVAYEVILAHAEPEMPQPPSLLCALTWMSGFSRMEAMIGIKSSSLSLKFNFKNKSL
jgi:hypothetical protein